MTRYSQTILVVSHEASGDLLADELINALRAYDDVKIIQHHSGSSTTQDIISTNIKPLSPVMGIGDVVGKLFVARKLLNELFRFVSTVEVDIIITIDAMALNAPLIRKIRKHRPSTLCYHYAAPKLWAWRPGRAHRLRGLFDQLFCLFPFEQDFFDHYQIINSFAGHPVIHRLSPGPNVREGILLLPGSRQKEIVRHLPTFLKAAFEAFPDEIITVVTFERYKDLVNQLAKDYPIRVMSDPSKRFGVFQKSKCALAASGTVSLELAMAHTPMVIAYKVDAISAFLAKRLITVPYVSLVNLILGRKIVPEHLQSECCPNVLAQSLINLNSEEQLKSFPVLYNLLNKDPDPASFVAGQVISASRQT
ncbi:MAG: hypothetical protein EBT20_02150 [Alphaproteobacteria bacterium]|nr:hypothetical protein [Alphaproteobacteria bacterium]